jgi:hypothetical protein
MQVKNRLMSWFTTVMFPMARQKCDLRCGGEFGDGYLVGCSTEFGREANMFQTILLPPFSGQILSLIISSPS